MSNVDMSQVNTVAANSQPDLPHFCEGKGLTVNWTERSGRLEGYPAEEIYPNDRDHLLYSSGAHLSQTGRPMDSHSSAWNCCRRRRGGWKSSWQTEEMCWQGGRKRYRIYRKRKRKEDEPGRKTVSVFMDCSRREIRWRYTGRAGGRK